MARPLKKGLDYFPLSVDFFTNDKIQLVEAENGVYGSYIILRLFCKIYGGEGYFYVWNDAHRLLLQRSLPNIRSKQIDKVVESCLKWGVFDESLFKKHNILTSKGIQSRFMEITIKRKQIEIVKEYWLLSKYPGCKVDFVKPIENKASKRCKVLQLDSTEQNFSENSLEPADYPLSIN